jgi:hypothetical protein
MAVLEQMIVEVQMEFGYLVAAKMEARYLENRHDIKCTE